MPENFFRYSKVLNKKLVCMKCILRSSLTKPLESQLEKASFQCNYLTEKNILPPTQNYVKAKWPWLNWSQKSHFFKYSQALQVYIFFKLNSHRLHLYKKERRQQLCLGSGQHKCVRGNQLLGTIFSLSIDCPFSMPLNWQQW